jgi:hypothetical protein
MKKNIVYIKKSNKSAKKYMVYIDGRTIHFGQEGYSDYTKHKDFERKVRYINRHKNMNENWDISGIKSAGFWSRWLLWNKTTITESKKDMIKRFNIQFKIWPSE